jgi:hypothetical protein
MDQYYKWNIFKGLFLEDSFVIDIKEDYNTIIFKMEFVLNEDHYLYKKPFKHEQYCYKTGYIYFNNVIEKKWILKNNSFLSVDADNESDKGNIDVFYKDRDKYYLEGDWGSILIKCKDVSVKYE